MASGGARIVPEQVLNFRIPEGDLSYDERDVALYALGVGAAAKDQTDPVELLFLYHPDGQKYIKVLPTFPVLFFGKVVGNLMDIPGLDFNPKLLLHGEMYLEIYKPLPTSAHIRCFKKLSGLHDKGKAALTEMELIYQDVDTGETLGLQRTVVFLRGAGGFSKPGQPFSHTSRSPTRYDVVGFDDKRHRSFETGPSDVEFRDHISLNQALLYRLSGDMNPLHSDPKFAADAGFERPILHGLCTLGFAVRAIIRCCCDGNSDKIVSVNARFLHHVYPGETLVTMMRKEELGSKIFFRCKVEERPSKAVLAGVICLRSQHSRL